MYVRPQFMYALRKHLLLGLNAKISSVNLMFKACRSNVTSALYKLQIRLYKNKFLLQKLLGYMMYHSSSYLVISAPAFCSAKYP